MKSEVLEIKEIGSGDFKTLEIKMRVENDDGEVLPEYLWTIPPNRTEEVLGSEEALEEELALITSEALDYIKRDKTLVENAKIEEKILDLKTVLTKKVKNGLTKEKVEEEKIKRKGRPADMLIPDREEQILKGILDAEGRVIENGGNNGKL